MTEMPRLATTDAHPPQGLGLSLARSASELEGALRLRHAVFAEELGAQLNEASSGIDRDEFDPWCDHLLVRDLATSDIVGTYRILPPHRAREIGRLYSESEFDLAPLEALRPSLVEVGRACVHPDWRQGPAILMLWAGLARYMREAGYSHLVGCASVSLADGGHQAAAVRDELMARHLSPPEHRVCPRTPFEHRRLARASRLELPPLLKGYLRLGARIGGEPAWDAQFCSADFLILLDLAALPPRYARHFHLLSEEAMLAAI